MDGAHALGEVQLLLADRGRVTVLEYETMPFMPVMELDGITGQQSLHHRRQGRRAGVQKPMDLVRHEHPGVAGRLRFRQKPRQPGEAILAIPVVPDDVPALDPSAHGVVHDPGCIESRLSWPDRVGTLSCWRRQLNYFRASLISAG